MQRTSLNGEVLDRFLQRTPASRRMFQEATRVTPGGVMAGIKFFEPYPLFMKSAAGSHIRDVDGNEYIDYLMSYGALILGHGHPSVKNGIGNALDGFGTTVTGTPTAIELEFGTILRDLYHKDGLIRFTNSGLEATLLAVRLAKGYTGKRKIAKFEGHYHGAVDHLLFSYAPKLTEAGKDPSPVPVADSVEVDDSVLSDCLVLTFNDWESTEQGLLQHANELACVILEPFEEGVIPGEPGFMVKLRKMTRELKVPLIYDEVKTGFRVRIGGATEFYGLTPDLACLGKIIGGGLPIGAVVGDHRIMQLLDPRRGGANKVFHSGTFNGNPLSTSTGMATVEELTRRGRFSKLCTRTNSLKRALSGELSERDIPHFVLGEGGMFNYYLTKKPVKNYRDTIRSDLKLRRLFDMELINRGVYLKPENRFCLSLAHSADDADLTAEKFGESLDELIGKRTR